MAEWSSHVNYMYNQSPSCHAYAYDTMYEPGAGQANGNLADWGEAGVNDFSSSSSNNNNNAEMMQVLYDNLPMTQDGSPPKSPEQRPCNYKGYVGDTRAGCLLLAGAQEASFGTGAKEARRVCSDSTSDTESYVSPDSWSSCSSREVSLPQTDPATWAKNGLGGEAIIGSPDPRKAGSTSHAQEPMTMEIIGKEGTNNGPVPVLEPEPEPEPVPVPVAVPLPVPEPASDKPNIPLPKAKVRVVFSESQMNILAQRFSVQRYLPPAEMKNLAEMTGLTYKQVKTWFQNRRMKLRRHQKDTSWVSERYATNSPMCGPGFNIPSHVPPYQGDAQPQFKEHYNQPMMGAAYKKTAPQNLAYYLTGAAGYPAWPSGPTQTAMPNRPQAADWSMSPGFSHYEYNPSAFNPAGVSANNPEYDTGYEIKDGEPVNGRSPFNTATYGHPIVDI